MYPSIIQKLIDLFSKFPTVGPRTASRFVFYLIKLPKQEFDNLAESMKKLRESVKTCTFCFNPFEASETESDLCPICINPSRDRALLCVVEKETDLISIEKTKKYKGIYFILGDAISTLKKDGEKKIRIQELIERIENPGKFGLNNIIFKEIIIATNPTTEGEATALLLKRKLKDLQLETKPKITRLGRGLPSGAELEYADDETLESAFEGRK
jgi:recombination protein RecR